MIIINPGSKLANGTEKQAVKNANDWVMEMRENGIRYVQIVGSPIPDGRFRWTFALRHSLTGVEATLAIHGLSAQEVEEYAANNLGAQPRIYWNGSSSAEPQLEDFLTEGYYIDIVREGES